MSAVASASPPPPEWVTTAEAAKLLGVSVQTIRRLGREDLIRSRRKGLKNLEYRREDVEARLRGKA